MKINKYVKIALAVLLCLAMLLPFIPAKEAPMAVEADAVPVNFHVDNVGTGFNGKKLSILGDSISTYAGVSNNSNSNATIGSNRVYYKENNTYGVTRADTWWQQAIDMLGMELCVNNSYSGSGVMGFDFDTSDSDTSVDYIDATVAGMSRARQLHTTAYTNTDGKTIPRENPDYIAVYLGTNDIKNRTSGLSTFAANKTVMLAEAKKLMAGTLQPKDAMKFSLYVYMIEQMRAEYPDAQIYLFTLLPNETQNEVQARAMDQYNQSIRDLVTYYQELDGRTGAVNYLADGKWQPHRVVLVDLYENTGITNDLDILEKHLANTLHPNAAGMDAITNCFLSELVTESGVATNRGNWRDIEYNLTDVYVEGGQINTYRRSGNMIPISFTLVPSRPEYGLDVKVELVKDDDTVVDMTSSYYSDGTVFASGVGHSYKKIVITAKAVYDTKNYRWELGAKGLETCINDGSDYNILGKLTENNISMISGSSVNGKLDEAQFKFADRILLRNEEPWVLEWKASGNMDWDQLLFSDATKSGTRSNTYVFFDDQNLTEKRLFIGYYNSYRSKFWNYGMALPSDLVFDEATSHVYRLTNVIADDGSNMVYLSIDGTNLGAMNKYAVGTTFQTSSELKEEAWLNGRDLEFSFMGAENSNPSHRLQDCKIEYIQVWEGGEFDTLRLQQLVNEYDELKLTLSGATNWDAYATAVTNAKNYLNGNKDVNNHQAYYDSLVDAILTARNNLTGTASGETKIYGVELMNSFYVPIGQPTALKVVTTPDVQKVQVGNSAQNLIVNTSSLQTMKVDGVETQVKVWLLTFVRSYKTVQVTQYRIHALKDANATASDTQHGDASVLFDVPYGAACFTALCVTKSPDKVKYVAGEKLDTTGMEVTAYFGDGSTSEVVTGYTVYNQAGEKNGALAADDTTVIIKYKHDTYGTLSVIVPITVAHHVADMATHDLNTEVVVQGYYVGVAQEGRDGDNELVLKDMNTNALIYIRNVPGTFPDYNYRTGDLLQIAGTLKADNTTATLGKRYIDYNEGKTGYSIISRENTVTFKSMTVVDVTSWDQLQTYINDGTIKQDTYVRFRGNLFISTYSSDTDPVTSYRLHMNSSATNLAGIKVNDKSLAIRANTLKKNLGSDPLGAIVDAEAAAGKFPGDQLFGSIIAVYTGGNSTYYSFTIFDSDWIDLM